MSKYTYTRREKRDARCFGLWLALFTRVSVLVQFGGCSHRFQHSTSLWTQCIFCSHTWNHSWNFEYVGRHFCLFFSKWITCELSRITWMETDSKTTSKVFECFCVSEHHVHCRSIRKRALLFWTTVDSLCYRVKKCAVPWKCVLNSFVQLERSNLSPKLTKIFKLLVFSCDGIGFVQNEWN